MERMEPNMSEAASRRAIRPAEHVNLRLSVPEEFFQLRRSIRPASRGMYRAYTSMHNASSNSFQLIDSDRGRHMSPFV